MGHDIGWTQKGRVGSMCSVAMMGTRRKLTACGSRRLAVFGPSVGGASLCCGECLGLSECQLPVAA